MKKISLIRMLSCFLLLMTQISYATENEIQVKSPVSGIKVKLFALNALFSVYDFDHSNITHRQKAAAKLFTGDGWANFLSAMNKSKLLDYVRKNKYQVTTTALRPALISKQALRYGVYYWDVEYPAMVVFKNEKVQQVQYLNIKQRVVYKNKELQVEKFLATQGKAINCEQTSKEITQASKTAPKKQPGK